MSLLSSFKQLRFGKPLFNYEVIPSTTCSKVLVCVFGHGQVREVFLSLDEWSAGTSPGYEYRIAVVLGPRVASLLLPQKNSCGMLASEGCKARRNLVSALEFEEDGKPAYGCFLGIINWLPSGYILLHN